MELFALRLTPGTDLKQALLEHCVEHQIEAAYILSCVGSLRHAAIRFADQDICTHIEKNVEILSLSGTLSQHGCHLHIAISDDQGKVIGGHLMAGTLIYTTAEIVLGVVPNCSFKRTPDSITGCKELFIEDQSAKL